MRKILTFEDLHTYQDVAAEFVLAKKRCALFLGMGLGKTGASLWAIDQLYDRLEICKPLVIGPRLVVEKAWIDEIQGWAFSRGLRVALIAGTQKQRIKALLSEADIYLVSRDNIAWLIKYMGKNFDFDAVFVDESSSFKDPTTKRFKALKSVASIPDYFVILTGTPIPTGYLDLWSQIYLLDFGKRLGRTYTHYKHRYFDQDWTGYKWTLREGCAEKIEKTVTDICLSMRVEDYRDTTKPEVIDEEFPLPSNALKLYAQMEQEFLVRLKHATVEAMNSAVLTNKLRQISAGMMYTNRDGTDVERVHLARREKMLELRARYADEPMFIAYHYKFEQRELQRMFPEAIHLKDPDAIEAWNMGLIHTLIAHPASAGHGLNLQKGGRRVVWYTVDYPPEQYHQFNARIDRQGQSEQVYIHRLLAQNTIDNVIVHHSLSGRAKTEQDFLIALREEIEQKFSPVR